MEQINFDIEEKIKQDFQIWCIKNNTNMKEILTKHIKNIIKK